MIAFVFYNSDVQYVVHFNIILIYNKIFYLCFILKIWFSKNKTPILNTWILKKKLQIIVRNVLFGIGSIGKNIYNMQEQLIRSRYTYTHALMDFRFIIWRRDYGLLKSQKFSKILFFYYLVFSNGNLIEWLMCYKSC